MPLYTYICPACGLIEETSCPYSGITAKLLCIHCNSEMVQMKDGHEQKEEQLGVAPTNTAGLCRQ